MKRSSLLKHLRKHGCVLKREVPPTPSGPTHALAPSKLFLVTPKFNNLARKIRRNLEVPEIGSE